MDLPRLRELAAEVLELLDEDRYDRAAFLRIEREAKEAAAGETEFLGFVYRWGDRIEPDPE